MRQGELLGLQWRDVDLKNKTLALRNQVRYLNGKIELIARTKTEKDRHIMWSRPAIEALEEHRKKCGQKSLTFAVERSCASNATILTIGEKAQAKSKIHRKCFALPMAIL
jgi:integrase